MNKLIMKTKENDYHLIFLIKNVLLRVKYDIWDQKVKRINLVGALEFMDS